MAGYKHVTADGEVSTSGQPVVIYDVQIVSGAGGAGSVILRNGTDSGGTAILTLTGTVSKGDNFPMGEVGVLFPGGCFLDLDANAAEVTVTYERI